MTPSDIEVLLHCHTSPATHPRASAPAVREAIAEFLFLGLIESCREGYGPDECQPYQTTEGGRVLVQALCSVPFPVKKWSMP